MARPFYPFVDNSDESGATDDKSTSLSASKVSYSARIAVYDDAAVAPRVVIIDPSDVRSYLEEITKQVVQLSHEQGGNIPFMVIREVVENFIHAYFIEPTISILDGGNTIRFSDQGPGIKEKDRALEYGTSSATDEMKQFIRGVGSGLPYAQQYMVDKGGSLVIEDNISQGTVVTISTKPRANAQVRPDVTASYAQSPAQQPGMDPQVAYQQSTPAGWGYPVQGYQQQWPQDQQQYSPGYAPYQQAPSPQAPYGQAPAGPMQQAGAPYPTNQWQQAGAPQAWQPDTRQSFSGVRLSERGHAILEFLSDHETVGPTDLWRAYGDSQPTWTRELQTLEEQGILKKEGQKRRLTQMGRALLEQLP